MDFKFCTKIGVYSSSSSQLNLGKEDLGIRNISAVFSSSWRKKDTSRLVSKWECFRLSALTSIEDDSSSSQFKSSQTDNNTLYHHLSQGFTFLPRPLSATNNSSLFKDNAAKMRIVYKGVPGAFGEVAALQAYPLCQAVPCENFEAAFKAVELCLADKAILPIENSKSGSFHRNYDLLLRHKLHIVAEVQMVINHCLLGLPGVKKEELKRVLSNTLAFAQCEVALSSLNIVKEGVDCTSGAAQIVASKSRRDTGAVASSRAAEIYGLNILAEKIQDDSDNITRFLVLERQPIIPKTDVPYKTSIVFNSEEGPGVVFKVLTVFANRDINLTKIESRPQRKQPLRVVDNSKNGNSTFHCCRYFDYIFYIDVEASLAEPRMQLALRHLQEFTTFVKVLGSYPTDSRLL